MRYEPRKEVGIDTLDAHPDPAVEVPVIPGDRLQEYRRMVWVMAVIRLLVYVVPSIVGHTINDRARQPHDVVDGVRRVEDQDVEVLHVPVSGDDPPVERGEVRHLQRG